MTGEVVDDTRVDWWCREKLFDGARVRPVARESVTSSQSVLLPGELGSCRQSVHLGVRLPSRLLT